MPQPAPARAPPGAENELELAFEDDTDSDDSLC